jgi:hypothetical protein
LFVYVCFCFSFFPCSLCNWPSGCEVCTLINKLKLKKKQYYYYMTSYFMEKRSLFVVVHVILEFISFVCNLERPKRLQYARRVCPHTSVIPVLKYLGLAVMIRPQPNHRNLCVTMELRVAFHLTKRPLR